jgi:GDP/UDP-N,N'-diacetylbacillosamine 2-epimerase (hydrolysing)
MKGLESSPEVKLQVCVTGMHLSPEFGLTYKEIEASGFFIDEKIEMLISSDTTIGISKSIGLAIISISEAFNRLQPDIIILLGDRFEIYAAATAAMVSRIPIVHCHGGETTEGVIDEAMRHCITKMSHLHFTSTEEYRKRVIQMGENPEYVFNVGALGIENINRLSLLSRSDFEESINFMLSVSTVLVTFHPATLEADTAIEQFTALLNALDSFPELSIIFTKANADAEGRSINLAIDEYVSRNPKRAISFISMGQLRYLSALRHVDMVIGNSSSGLIEAPSFHIPTINIGDRQKGRIRGSTVIDCEPNKEAIIKSISKGLSTDFRQSIINSINPYGSGNAYQEIIKDITSINISNLIKKKFHDL